MMTGHPHPGEHLRQLMDKAHISNRDLAKHLGVSASYLCEVSLGKSGVSTVMAIRLGRAFGPSFGADAQFWAEAQMEWDLQRAWAKFPPEEMPKPLYELEPHDD